MKKLFYRFMQDESGIGVVEIILILVVLIGLVVIFRDQLTSLMNGIFERIVQDSNAV
ncbi:MAG: holin, BlyA family protein [Lachnospiraceae bacterium]|nr:holin, BlyA family protein [Lachnospiraceae bacterium]